MTGKFHLRWAQTSNILDSTSNRFGLHKNDENVPANKQQQRKKEPNQAFFIKELGIHIDIGQPEWISVDMQPNCQEIFDDFKKYFMSKSLKRIKYDLQWDDAALGDQLFLINEKSNEILINKSLAVRSRDELSSTILHILLHVYLFVTSKGKINPDDHNGSFRGMMLDLNEKLGVKITTSHKLLPVLEPVKWYQSTGDCQHASPFYGVFELPPTHQDEFKKYHKIGCAGKMFKIYEATRSNTHSNSEEVEFVRHAKFTEFITKGGPDLRRKTNIQPNACIDLLDDNIANIQSLVDVIDLTNDIEVTDADNHHQFKFECGNFNICPLSKKLMSRPFADHVKSCHGKK